MKEAISKFREAEIDHLAISASEKEELKSGWKNGWMLQPIDFVSDVLECGRKFRVLNIIDDSDRVAVAQEGGT